MSPTDAGPPAGPRRDRRDAHRAPDSTARERRASREQPTAFGHPNASERHAATAEAGPRYETGTTIVGLCATDGVVLAADQRMSLGGSFATCKDVRKVERVHPTAAMAISGTVGPAQELLQQLRAETELYAARRGDSMSMTALSRTAGHLVRGLPVMPLLGGVDDDGGHVYELDGGGSVVEDAYAAGGSGMQLAYGVLERRFEPESTIEDVTEDAIAAVEAACERDGASGDGVTIATVTSDGVDFATRGAS